MQIHLSDISSSEGMRIQKTAEFGMDTITFQSGSFPVLAKEPIELTITNTGDRVLELEGSGLVIVGIPCDRCLEDVEVKVTLDFKHKIDTESDAYDQSEDLDENNYIDGYSLDVEQLVYNELLVGWPTKILCSEDCKGICNVCGQNLNKGTCNCEDTGLDPRMSVIRDVFKNFKEV